MAKTGNHLWTFIISTRRCRHEVTKTFRYEFGLIVSVIFIMALLIVLYSARFKINCQPYITDLNNNNIVINYF